MKCLPKSVSIKSQMSNRCTDWGKIGAKVIFNVWDAPLEPAVIKGSSKISVKRYKSQLPIKLTLSQVS